MASFVFGFCRMDKCCRATCRLTVLQMDSDTPQALTGTLILCATLHIYWFFCFSKNPDGGLQKQTRPPQRHSDQRDPDQAPQQHPPQPPTRQLPDNGEQENSAPTWHTFSEDNPLFIFFVFLYVALRWFLSLTSTSLFLRGKVWTQSFLLGGEATQVKFLNSPLNLGFMAQVYQQVMYFYLFLPRSP